MFNGNGFLHSALDGVARTITFIGQTARSLSLSPDQRTPVPRYSAIFEHCQATGHNINPRNVKVLLDENNTIKRRVKKAIAIKLRIPPEYG